MALTIKQVQQGEARLTKVNLFQTNDAGDRIFQVWGENDNRDKTAEDYLVAVNAVAELMYNAHLAGDDTPVPSVMIAFNDGDRMQLVDGALRYDAANLLKVQHPEVEQLKANVRFVPNPYTLPEGEERNAAISKLVAVGITSQTTSKDLIAVVRIIKKMFDLDSVKAGRNRRIANETGINAQQIGQYVDFFSFPQEYQDLFYSKFAAFNTVMSAHKLGVTPAEMVQFFEKNGAPSGVGKKSTYKIETKDLHIIDDLKKSIAAHVEEVQDDEDEQEEALEYEQEEDDDSEQLQDDLLAEDNEIDDRDSVEPPAPTQHPIRDTEKLEGATTSKARNRAPKASKAPSVKPTEITRDAYKQIQQEQAIQKAGVIKAFKTLQEDLHGVKPDEDGLYSVRLTQYQVDQIVKFGSLIAK